MLEKIQPDAVEIHTEINRTDSFKKLVGILKNFHNTHNKLKNISISCGLNQSSSDLQQPYDLLKEFWEKYEILSELNIPLIWQLDGKPMSGDLSPSTGISTVKLFESIGSQLPPGLIQLAGGTNGNTYKFLKENNLPDGIGFGSSARKIMQPFIEFANKNNKRLYEYPEKMTLAIEVAKNLIKPWKSY